MKRVLVLMEHRENRRLLTSWLREHYEVIVPAAAEDLAQPFDLAIVDLPALLRNENELRARKEADHPRFLPLVLLAPMAAMSSIPERFWQVADKVISVPVARRELRPRLEILLRVRLLGIDVAAANEQLRHEVAEREHAQRRLRAALRLTRRLFRAAADISALQTPEDVVTTLIADYPKPVFQASALAFDRPWNAQRPQSFRFIALLDEDKPWIGQIGMSLPLTAHPFARLFALADKQPVLVRSVLEDRRLSDTARGRLLTYNIHSALLLPLRARGAWFGMLSLYADRPNHWTRTDRRYFRALVDQVAVVLDNIRLLETEARARREAEHANALKNRFLGMISHELRTPLTPIRGLASTLLAEDIEFDREQQREFIRAIEDEARKLTRLVDELIDLSRIQAGTFSISPQPCAVSALVEGASVQLESLAAGHTLDVCLPGDLPPVQADPERIAQVLTNLVGNAAKYAPRGTTISIRAEHAGDMVRMDVSDEGPGIPPDQHDTAFEAFQQLDSGNETAKVGAGLGLAICRGLVEAHGGRIWIEDTPAPGATLSFTLPVAAG